ncbi:MAG TPA: thiamine phosphate synthase [bacterium]|nr:thiamine phosphate synthase [bacterium]
MTRRTVYPIVGAVPEELGNMLRILRPAFLQLRMKGASDEDVVAAALSMRESIRRSGAGTRLVMNDRPDIAVRCGVSVVHVGDEDMPPSQVRRRYPDLAVGWSAHTLDDIERANSFDLIYVAFGPVFPSATKVTGRAPVLALVPEALRLSRHPLVFIGGIAPDNIEQLPFRHDTQAAVIGALQDFMEQYRHD